MKQKLAGIIIWGIIIMASVSGYCAEAAAGTAQETAGKAADTDYLKIGFDLMKNETIGFLKIGISDSDVVTGLDEPDNKSEVIIWGADGREHQRWYYPTKGIELDMIRRDGTQIVNMIRIKSPCDLITKRGIGVGSTAQDVQSAYKNELNPEFRDSKLVAGTVYGGIIFDLNDGVVSSIFIGAAAE